MSLPTAIEINPFPGGLDGEEAVRHFLGKTLEEAEGLFRENSLYYQEDLMWMGPAAFRYYVQAAIQYLQSDAAKEDDAVASCLTSIFEFRLEHEAPELRPIADKLTSTCRYLLDHYQKFDLDPEIDGDLRPRLQTLEETFQRMINV